MTIVFSVPVAATQTQDPARQTLDPAPLGGAISIPLPSPRENDLKKYEIPELAGTAQASGSQLIAGHLPLALVDYSVKFPGILQRITIFQGGLVAVRMEGNQGTIQKKVRLPDDAFRAYLDNLRGDDLNQIRAGSLSGESGGVATIRIRNTRGELFERRFDASLVLPNALQQKRSLLEDLLRAISEDREVTNSVSGYVPHVGDRLVADDKRSYEVTRLLNGGEIVELSCIGQPSHMYVSVRDLHNLFIGARGGQAPRP